MFARAPAGRVQRSIFMFARVPAGQRLLAAKRRFDGEAKSSEGSMMDADAVGELIGLQEDKPPVAFDPRTIERPDPKLFHYYIWMSLLSGPLTPIVLLPMWFRYITLRYKLDDDGVSMQWGILFRREVYLTYRRIQDIHLTRNLLQRWMGLANISLQTASGSSQAELVIEGMLYPELIRDFLYARMRGAKNETAPADQHAASQALVAHSDLSWRTELALIDIRNSLRKLVELKSDAAQDKGESK